MQSPVVVHKPCAALHLKLKTMKFSQILLVTFCVVSNSCVTNKREKNSLEKISILSLKKSNDVILKLSNTNYASIQNKLKETIYGEKLEFWNGKALKLKVLTSEIVSHIESLKRKQNVSIDTINFLKNKYIHDVKSIDTTLYEILNQNKDNSLNNLTKGLSVEFVIEKIKNDILVSESKMSSYLDNKTSMIKEDFSIFSTIVSQNTKHLKAGENLEIWAGIGSFSIAANPTFVINGINVKPDESATAKYIIKVSGKGKKTIPVRIFYISNKGSKESKEIELDYYVHE